MVKQKVNVDFSKVTKDLFESIVEEEEIVLSHGYAVCLRLHTPKPHIHSWEDAASELNCSFEGLKAMIEEAIEEFNKKDLLRCLELKELPRNRTYLLLGYARQEPQPEGQVGRTIATLSKYLWHKKGFDQLSGGTQNRLFLVEAKKIN